MANLKDFLIVKMWIVTVMLVLVGLAGGMDGEEDNLAMESMRGSLDDDYDFAAFLAKAGEVLGEPGGDWGNRLEEAVPRRDRITQSRSSPSLRLSQARKGNQRVAAGSQLEAVGRTRVGSSQFQVDPLANVSSRGPTGEIVDRLVSTSACRPLITMIIGAPQLLPNEISHDDDDM